VPFENEQRVLGKDGKYRWFLVRYNPLLDAQGKIDRWYVAAFDIDDRKRTEWLREAEMRILQMIADGASLTDILNHVCTSVDAQVSPRFTSILLMDPDGKRLWPTAGPKVPEEWVRAITPLPVAADTGLCGTAAFLKERVIAPDIANESIWREEYRPIALKNALRAAWSQPILSKENEVLGTFGVYSAESRGPTTEDLALMEAAARTGRDIALIAIERQRSQEALRNALDEIQQSESKLRQVIDTIPALAWCNLPHGPNEFLNKGWHEYTGLSVEESHGWGWQTAFHPADLAPLMEKWTKMLTSGEPDEIEARLRRHAGVYRWFLIRAQPFRDESGNIVRWYGTSTDIEDRKRAEDVQARQARVRADVSAAFSRPTHLREILRGCTEAIVRHLDAAFARIWMLNKDESMLELQASAGMYTRLDGTYSRIPVGDLKVGLIAREKKAHFTNDVTNDPRVHDKRWAQDYGMVAFAGYPLVVEDRLIGVLALFARCQLSESILDTLASVADTIAQGIERRRAEEALWSSERNLAAIISTIPTTAWTTRPDGYCDFLNQVWLDYAGMTAEQAQGWGWAEAIHPEDRKRLIEEWQLCLASGTPVNTEARIRRFDAAYRWFLIRGNPLRDERGNILKWYGTCLDIEDRKRGEEALRVRELSWRQIVDNIPGLVATTGAMGEVEFLNRQTLEYFGNTSEELKNWALIGAVHPDDLPRVIEARKKSIIAGDIYDIEHRCRRAEGVYRWFQVRGLPVRDAEGTIATWYLLLTDIDDRKKAEEALRSSERNLSLMINAIPTSIHVLRTDGSVLYANQAVLDYSGLRLEDVQREDYRSRVFHPEDVERLREERRDALARAVPFETEQRVLGKDGQYRWFLIRYNPLLDERGKIDRWYVAATDIDDRKHAEAQVEQAYLRLAEAQRLSKTGSFITDLLLDEHDWSEEAFRIFEFDPAAKVTVQMIRDTIHPEDLPTFEAVIARGMTGW